MTDVVTHRSGTRRPVRDRDQTAEVFLSGGQQLFAVVTAILGVVAFPVFGVATMLKVVAALITLFYLVFVTAKLFVSAAGASAKLPENPLPSVGDAGLPTWSIIVPMKGEKFEGLTKLLEALSNLRYPAEKLQLLFVVDANDGETIEMVRDHGLPSNGELVIAEAVGPMTKPKACNIAMQYANGYGTVIFDFEDRPEPDALLIAVADLGEARRYNPRVACVQGILQFWNPRGGKANPFYWAEYSTHFKRMLRGMARMGLIPPLGGTSNYFITSALWDVAKQYGTLTIDGVEIPNIWDSYNVTEDADLAARLKRCGYDVAMTRAVTYEEAPNTLKKAKNQKSRWLKGYAQTFLVQSRSPLKSMREMGVWRYLMYNLFIGGTPLSFILNPIVWLTTVLYVLSRLMGWLSVTGFIEGLFPAPVYYTAMTVAIVGNGVLLFQMLLTPLQQQEDQHFQHQTVGMQRQQYGLCKFLLLGPLWWVFTTVPAYKGIYELVHPGKRYHWNKTPHGNAIHKEEGVLGGPHERRALSSGAPSTLSHQAPEHNRVN